MEGPGFPLCIQGFVTVHNILISCRITCAAAVCLCIPSGKIIAGTVIKYCIPFGKCYRYTVFRRNTLHLSDSAIPAEGNRILRIGVRTPLRIERHRFVYLRFFPIAVSGTVLSGVPAVKNTATLSRRVFRQDSILLKQKYLCILLATVRVQDYHIAQTK